MGYLQEYCLQVLVEGEWINYSLCRTLPKAIKMSLEELSENPFRVLGYKDGEWVECLLSGSMLSVEHKDFRMLTHWKGAVCSDSVVEINRLLSRV